MITYLNPFEYEAATKFTTDELLDFYIEDYNYSRFIRSRRNIFLVGERGTGKTMAFLYNSLPVRQEADRRADKNTDLSFIGVYVPCKTHLTHKKEYELLDPFQASVLSEHYFVTSIMYHVVDTLSKASGVLDGADSDGIREDIEYILGLELPKGKDLFRAVSLACEKQVVLAQKAANRRDPDSFYEGAVSFSSSLLPLLSLLTRLPRLSKSHWSLMLDDAHDLNRYQMEALNSWIAYRDHSLFSFKVATAKVERPSYKTASGGSILEGHDFTLLDMEQPYQNRYSLFGKLARQIVRRRLDKIVVHKEPDDFFPPHPQFEKDLAACRAQAEEEAHKKYPNGTAKQKADYVYKYARARYFQERDPKANLPAYSGFDTIVHISTGVIRNLLEPCYWMYDQAVSQKRGPSEKRADGEESIVTEVPPTIQSAVLLEISQKRWKVLKEGLDNTIDGCSRKQATQLFRLFDHLAMLFRARLHASKSEPRAISFTISEPSSTDCNALMELLNIARKAQMLYTYTSSAKDYGKRETYYVPNRILWPQRGLDPHGQHARVSIRAKYLMAAAKENKRIPFKDESEPGLGGLFDE